MRVCPVCQTQYVREQLVCDRDGAPLQLVTGDAILRVPSKSDDGRALSNQSHPGDPRLSKLSHEVVVSGQGETKASRPRRNSEQENQLPSVPSGSGIREHTAELAPLDQMRLPSKGIVPSKQDERIGKTLGSYKIIETLGSGGMGYVYRAEHVKLGREVALKLLRDEYAKRRDAVARFFQEARAVNKIRHRNIVDVSDLVELPDGSVFIIMELLKGFNLDRLMNAPMGIHPSRALGIIAQLCDGLSAAHAVGIVHRDLKPDNIVVVAQTDGTDLVKVLDFGVAKLTDGEEVTQLTVAGSVVGTPAYMSPEQAGGFPVDWRADLYSLGAIVYEIFTRQPVFRGTSFGEYVRKHLSETPIPPHAVAGAENIHPRIEAMILRCLEKSPAARFQTAAELKMEVVSILAMLEAGGASRFYPGTPVPLSHSGSGAHGPMPVTPRPGQSAVPMVHSGNNSGPQNLSIQALAQGPAQSPVPVNEVATRAIDRAETSTQSQPNWHVQSPLPASQGSVQAGSQPGRAIQKDFTTSPDAPWGGMHSQTSDLPSGAQAAYLPSNSGADMLAAGYAMQQASRAYPSHASNPAPVGAMYSASSSGPTPTLPKSKGSLLIAVGVALVAVVIALSVIKLTGSSDKKPQETIAGQLKGGGKKNATNNVAGDVAVIPGAGSGTGESAGRQLPGLPTNVATLKLDAGAVKPVDIDAAPPPGSPGEAGSTAPSAVVTPIATENPPVPNKSDKKNDSTKSAKPEPFKVTIASNPVAEVVSTTGGVLCKTPCVITINPKAENSNRKNYVLRAPGYREQTLTVDTRKPHRRPYSVTLVKARSLLPK